MDIIKEKAATVDGVTAPVECIEMQKKDENPDLYAHFHDYVELLYLYSGQMKVWLNGLEHEFLQGELIIINSGETHRLESVAPSSSYYVIKFSPEILYGGSGTGRETRCILPFLSSASTHPRVFSEEFISLSQIPSLIRDAVNEWNNKKPGYELALKGDVLKIFRFVVGYLDEQGVEIKYSAGAGTLYAVMSDIVDRINKNFVRVDERKLAEEYDFSYSYFSRSFKQLMNMSFKEYVNFLRINEAQRLLLTTEKSVAEIADALGFSSPSHFVNVFKRTMGRAPKQYRKALASVGVNNGEKTESNE